MDDLIVIGAGWSGLAAAAFALNRGAKVRLIAQGIGSVIVTPGWISVWDSIQGNLTEAVKVLAPKVPDHPYSLVGAETVQRAVAEFVELLQSIGLVREGQSSFQGQNNLVVGTALGSFHHVAAAPDGLVSISRSSPVYIGFEGWRDYYPSLTGQPTMTVKLPMAERPWDATPTDIAREFDNAGFRENIAKQIKPRLNGATSVAFPAVLGLEQPSAVIQHLSQLIGIPVFEVPTLPPSVPGTRLFNKLRRHFLDNGVRVQIGHPVAQGIVENGRVVGVEIAAAGKPQLFRAKSVILATGGLYGGGLFSDDRGQIWEPVFKLPVSYDPDRTHWFNPDLLAPRGHTVHHFGVRVNGKMQPIDTNGTIVLQSLYAIGRLLALPVSPDAPLPSESMEGIAVSTALKAVQSALEN